MKKLFTNPYFLLLLFWLSIAVICVAQESLIGIAVVVDLKKVPPQKVENLKKEIKAIADKYSLPFIEKIPIK